MWKKRKNRKQDKFKYLLGRKVHRIIFFCNLKHKKNHHIHKVAYSIFILKQICDGFFYITTKFFPFIKSVIGLKFNTFTDSTTTFVDIFQFSFVNIKKLRFRAYLINRWLTIKNIGDVLQLVIVTSSWEQGDQSQKPLIEVGISKSSTSK